MLILVILLLLSFPSSAYAAADITKESVTIYCSAYDPYDPKWEAGGRRDGDNQNDQGLLPTEDNRTITTPDYDDSSAYDTTAPVKDDRVPGPEAFTVLEEVMQEVSGVVSDKYTQLPEPIPNIAPPVILSAEQLEQQSQVNPENMTFIESSIKLVVPTNTLTDLHLDSADQFSVSLNFNGLDKFQIQFFINQTELTDWADKEFIVYIPWSNETDAIYCYQTRDELMEPSGYDNHFLQFNLHRPGTYQIISDLNSQTTVTQDKVNHQQVTDSATTSVYQTETDTAVPPTDTIPMPSLTLTLVSLSFLLLTAAGILFVDRRKRRSEKR